MRPRILLPILLTALFVIMSGCGGVKNCPVCGTTKADGYAVIDVMPVPEHNPTGEPGGPFNSFDISVTDSVNHRFFVSDRIGLDVAVFDTQQDVAVNFFSGANGVAGGGVTASSCATDDPAAHTILFRLLLPGLAIGLASAAARSTSTSRGSAPTTYSAAFPAHSAARRAPTASIHFQLRMVRLEPR